ATSYKKSGWKGFKLGYPKLDPSRAGRETRMSTLAALCSTPGCGGHALSGISSCWEHHPDPDGFRASIVRRAAEELDLARLWLVGVDLSGLELVGANLAEA